MQRLLQMMIRIIIGFIMVLNAYSCMQPPLKSGLLIDCGPNQGMTHTDKLGTKHNYRHITATITNDSTVPIHLQIDLSNEYDYPAACNTGTFKAFLLPKELTPDTPALHNNILMGLDDFLDSCLAKPYVLNQTLAAGEKLQVTFGTLYAIPTNCGIVPNAIFSQIEKDDFQSCDILANQAQSIDTPLALGLKLDMYLSFGKPDGCIIIPCGQISYPEP